MSDTLLTPRTDAAWNSDVDGSELEIVSKQLERELNEKTNDVAKLTGLVEWYKARMESCWHAANTYDGNYLKACDNVMHIASERLLVKEELKPKIK